MTRLFKMQGKINIVDSYNNLVGFDINATCCESFGVIVNGEKLDLDSKDLGKGFIEFEGVIDFIYTAAFNFEKEKHEGEPWEFDDKYLIWGQSLCKIELDEDEIIFYNDHNGYYSHTVTIKDDTKIRRVSL